jgi:hypothetical protein
VTVDNVTGKTRSTWSGPVGSRHTRFARKHCLGLNELSLGFAQHVGEEFDDHQIHAAFGSPTEVQGTLCDQAAHRAG